MEIKRILIAIFLVCAIGMSAHAADVARQVDFLAAGLEQDGNALTGGKVFTYEAGTTTAKECWTNRTKSSSATNPVILSSEGRFTLFCDGVYKMVIKDADDVTLVTMDGISYGESGVQTTNLSSYGSLSEAIADIGSAKTVLILDTTDTLDENVGVPTNVTLMPLVRDSITLNGKTLTVNGDIWAGAFEWIIGTGTFTGSPTVQFYDNIWTASTVTDSATPSYTSILIGTPNIINGTLSGQPIISDFTNATHAHANDASGGSLSSASVRDTYRNLSIVNSGLSNVVMSADEFVAQDTNSTPIRVLNLSETIDITNSGAHGLDTGSEATSTWYYVWVIANATESAGMLSASSTAPTMPSGYTYKGLAGAVYNDSGDDLDTMVQSDKVIHIPQIKADSGSICGSWGLTPTGWSIASYIPPTASKVYGWFHADTSVAPVTIGIYSTANASGGSGLIIASTITESSFFDIPISTSQVVYLYRSTANATLCNLYITGWEY